MPAFHGYVNPEERGLRERDVAKEGLQGQRQGERYRQHRRGRVRFEIVWWKSEGLVERGCNGLDKHRSGKRALKKGKENLKNEVEAAMRR